MDILTRLGFHIGSLLVWAKSIPALSFADYNYACEFAVYGWLKSKGKHPWYGSSKESTLWRVERDPVKSYVHPTQKPIELAERAIRNSSVKDSIVLDSFIGSVTRLIASDRLGRRCFGMEIDERYCDAIVKRFANNFGMRTLTEDVREKYFKEVQNE